MLVIVPKILSLIMYVVFFERTKLRLYHVKILEVNGAIAWEESERPAAFYVEIEYDQKEAVMQESFWDKGVKVRNWLFPRKKSEW